ncbi:APC family permease [Bacillus spizizenii]|uniref:APC family permease n=1 Tax=Bacillus spizizenii TaxID=96241 RepID=UPI0002EC0BC4|nr:APC family permease [Bacillus spizizenii]
MGMKTKNIPDNSGLRKVMKTRDLVIFGMVFMAPVSAQTLFSELSRVSTNHAVLSYLVALVAMLFTALSYGKMAGTFPSSGSTYSYTSKAIHPVAGFIAGWGILLDYLLMPILLCKLSAVYALELFPGVPFWFMLLVFFLPVTISNSLGAAVSSIVNIFMTAIMLISLFLFVGFAIKHISATDGMQGLFTFKGLYQADTFSFQTMMAGASIAVLSYLGFDAVTTMAEDSTVKGKMVGRAAVIALFMSAFLYCIQAYFATLITQTIGTLKSPDTAFFEIAQTVGGNSLALLITLVISISGISTALAGQASSSRIIFSMARDKRLPASFAKLHPRFKTPYISILTLAVLGYLGALCIPLSIVYTIMVFGGLIGFICVNLSVISEFSIKRRKMKGLGFFSYFLFPAIGFLISTFILFSMDVIGKTVGVLWLIFGLVILGLTEKGIRVKEINIDEFQ